MKINKQIRITGKVQGVFFRNSTRQKARQLGITGWVRNEADGTVLAEIEGFPQAVKQMEIWLHKGPERAEVRELIIDEGNLKGHVDFEVKK
jgi:acylphosphatase